MSGRLWLFSSNIERDAAFPNGIPQGIRIGVTGVGLVDAGIATVDYVRQAEPTEIVFFGTCGAYPGSGLNIGDLVAGGTVRLGSGDTERKEMRVPKLLPSELKCSPEVSQRLVSDTSYVSNVRVVCTMGITENDALAETLSSLGDVENLELFAVLRAAGRVPVAGLLGVTNRVGAGGGKDWLANYKTLMAKIVKHTNGR